MSEEPGNLCQPIFKYRLQLHHLRARLFSSHLQDMATSSSSPRTYLPVHLTSIIQSQPPMGGCENEEEDPTQKQAKFGRKTCTSEPVCGGDSSIPIYDIPGAPQGEEALSSGWHLKRRDCIKIGYGGSPPESLPQARRGTTNDAQIPANVSDRRSPTAELPDSFYRSISATQPTASSNDPMPSTTAQVRRSLRLRKVKPSMICESFYRRCCPLLIPNLVNDQEVQIGDYVTVCCGDTYLWIARVEEVRSEEQLRVLWAYGSKCPGAPDIAYEPMEVLLSDYEDVVYKRSLTGYVPVTGNCRHWYEARCFWWNRRFKVKDNRVVEAEEFDLELTEEATAGSVT